MDHQSRHRGRSGSRRGTARAVALGAVLVLAAADVARADDASAALAEDEGFDVLLVTAEKREQDVQRTGGSVVILNESMLDDRGILDVKGISEYVPNLKIHTNVGGNTGFAINIRGAIKGDPILSREPVVGLYVDDVYMSNMVGILYDFLDLEAIEVLRGPQGTLYGRNTNGGAVKVRTKKPESRLLVRDDVLYGNYHSFGYRKLVNIPLVGDRDEAWIDTSALGTLSTRTSVALHDRRGFIDVGFNSTIEPGSADQARRGADRLDDLDRWAVRHRVLWEPADAVEVDYIYDRMSADERPTATQLSATSGPGTSFFLGPFVRNDRVDNISVGDGANGNALRSTLDVEGHSLAASWELPPLPVLGDVVLKSITAYREKESDDAVDIDGTGYRFFESGLRIEHEQWTQELQMNGDTAGGAVQYVAGFFFFDEDGKAWNDQDFLQDPIYGGSGPMIDFLLRSLKRSYAGYAQVDWTPPVCDDRVTLTGGLRYTYEETSIDVRTANSALAGTFPGGVLIDTGIGGAPNIARPSDDFDDVSWLARLQFQVTPDVMAYYKVNTGFLAGGFNARNVYNPNLFGPPGPGQVPFGTPFDPERLLSHEIGIRSDLLRRRVRFNATWFYYDYEDIQVSVFAPSPLGGATTEVVNAAEARIWGAELELFAQPFDGAELMLLYGYTKPEYRSFRDPVLGDVSNARGFAQTPAHTVVVGGGYQLPAFTWGTVMGRMDWSWSDEVIFSDTPNAAIDQTRPFWTLNAMLQVADVEVPGGAGMLRTQFWVKNITDEDYKEFGFSLLDAFPPGPGGEGVAVNTYTDPRTYGVTLVWQWEQ